MTPYKPDTQGTHRELCWEHYVGAELRNAQVISGNFACLLNPLLETFSFKIYFFILCVCVCLHVCMQTLCVCAHVCVQVCASVYMLEEARRGHQTPRTGITDGREPSCGWSELNLGPLPQHRVLLAVKPSLQQPLLGSSYKNPVYFFLFLTLHI